MWVEKCAASNCYLCVMQPCWISQCQFLQQFWQLYSCVRSGVSVKLQASTLNRTTPMHWISGTFGTKICLQSLGIEFLVVIIPLLRFTWYIFRNSLQLSGRPLCFTTGIYISRSAQILNLHYLYLWDHVYPFLTFKPSKEQLVMPQKEPWDWWCNLWIMLKFKVLKVINFAERSHRIFLLINLLRHPLQFLSTLICFCDNRRNSEDDYLKHIYGHVGSLVRVFTGCSFIHHCASCGPKGWTTIVRYYIVFLACASS